jgi:hypothetical protein
MQEWSTSQPNEDEVLKIQWSQRFLSGCFVEMMFTLDIGTKLKIDIWVSDVKVSTEGTVVTRLRNLGNGIQFTKLGPEDRARLKQFLTAAESMPSGSTNPTRKQS